MINLPVNCSNQQETVQTKEVNAHRDATETTIPVRIHGECNQLE